MSRVLLILMVTLGAGAAAWGQGVTKLPKVIYLTAVDGKKVAVKTQAAEKATVLAWTNLGCPMCKIYRPRLESMAAEYAAKGIRFVLIDSSQQDHAAALKVANEELSGDLRGDLRILRDLAAKVARKLKVTRTTEILVAGRDGKVVYRGALDDQYGYRKREAGGVGSYRKYAPEQNYLREALDAILAGKKPEVSSTAALGCALNLNWKETKAKAGIPTFHGDVESILQSSCQDCHHDGGSAPFSLQRYEDAKGWAEMIGEVVHEGRMPPWGASAKHGEFSNERRLSTDDKKKILSWVKNGAPRGDAKKAPKPRKFESAWMIGKPDLVIELEPFEVAAEGRLEYRYVSYMMKLKKDRFVQSYEIRSTSPEVVHHVLVFAKDPNRRANYRAKRTPWRQRAFFTELVKGATPQEIQEYMVRAENMDHRRAAMRTPLSGGLFGYFASATPGEEATVHGDGIGQWLPAGTELIFQIHYTPDGSKRVSQTKMALKFCEQIPKKNLDVQAVSTVAIKIPPQAKNHTIVQEKKLLREALLVGLHPHMHLRGKSFRYDAIYPDGKEEILLDVPAFDFDWQFEYRLKEPKLLPKGTVIRTTAVYDNSADNPYNPDSNETVWFGLQSDEEMMIGYFKVIWSPNKPMRFVPQD